MHQPAFNPSPDSSPGGAPVGFSPAWPPAAKMEPFFSTFPSPLAVWDFEGRIRQANSVFQRLISYSLAELEGHDIFDFVHPDDLAASAAAFRNLLVTGELTAFECRTRCKDGSYRWIVVNATAIHGEKLIYVAAHDITKRKRAEEALQRSEQWLRFAQGAAGVGIWDWDSTTRETRASDQQFRLYGLDPATKFPIGEEFLRLIHPGDRNRLAKELDGATAGNGHYESRFRVVWPDGSVHWLFARGRTYRGETGEPARFIGANVDITDRIRAESTLEEFFDRSPAPLAIAGFDGSLRRANGALLSISGLTLEELRQGHFVDFFHPEDRAALGCEFSTVVATGKSATLEARGLTRDGSIRWLLLSLAAVEDQKLVYITAYDITNRKLAEDALRESEHRFRRSNAELERFAYVASHDLQEPLRMVASFTQLLSKRYSGQLDETADRYIHYAVDGAKRMQELISDLLGYSRVNGKDLDLQQAEFEAVVREAMGNLQVAIEESGAAVDWDPLPRLRVDQAQFTQLFQNLLGNAIKFKRSDERPRIHVSAVETGAEWVFSVRDNGIGIDPRQADRVFQIFQRLHTRAEYPGTGIGLAICKKVVERHGGRIWVESEPGAGSTFRFTIPNPGGRNLR